MLSFAVYSKGEPAERVTLAGAYVVGTDDVPLRAEITFKDGVIHCKKRAAGPAGLALLWKLPDVGDILLETIRVPERDKPYVLQVELARGRLMRIQHKLEDWGLAENAGAEAIIAEVERGRDLLIKALQADSPGEAAKIGEEALAVAVKASEELTHYHAEVFLQRRAQTGGFGKRTVGCSVDLVEPTDALRDRIVQGFDFVTLPIVWRNVEPSEQAFNWKQLDAWVELLDKYGIPMHGSALLSFNEQHVPDWLYIWEHDFDTIRDLAFEHVRRVLNRYGQYIQSWNVISGIHANNCFTFNFEQLIELTRMATALTKQVCPKAVTIIDLVSPWGEYYARNQRTIPPLLYADMAVQSGINFDAFGIQFHFGQELDGRFVRDMFQISALLDLFAKMGRPVHITAFQVPSKSGTDGSASKGKDATAGGGMWRKPWSEDVQSEWLTRFFEIALSKPFVESLSWHGLVDLDQGLVPHGGLLRWDHEPKAAFEQLLKLRSNLSVKPKK
jgi:GH35 family endo-1,4-beta-xylanase